MASTFLGMIIGVGLNATIGTGTMIEMLTIGSITMILGVLTKDMQIGYAYMFPSID